MGLQSFNPERVIKDSRTVCTDYTECMVVIYIKKESNATAFITVITDRKPDNMKRSPKTIAEMVGYGQKAANIAMCIRKSINRKGNGEVDTRSSRVVK